MGQPVDNKPLEWREALETASKKQLLPKQTLTPIRFWIAVENCSHPDLKLANCR
jgi:hypothetical protein